MQNTITEMNNTLKGINSRFDEAEDQISNLENKVEKNIQSKQQKERKNPKKLRIA